MQPRSRIVARLLMAVVLCAQASTGAAMRYVEFTISLDGRSILEASTGDEGEPTDVVWRYLNDLEWRLLDNYEINADADNPLQATLQGDIVLAAPYGGRAATDSLTLVRDSADADEWRLAPADVDRTFALRDDQADEANAAEPSQPPQTPAPPAAKIVVTLAPGESQDVELLWEDGTGRMPVAFLTTTADEPPGGQHDFDGAPELTQDGLTVAYDEQASGELAAALADAQPPAVPNSPPSWKTTAVLHCSVAPTGAKPGLHAVFLHIVSGTGRDMLLTAEIRVLVGK